MGNQQSTYLDYIIKSKSESFCARQLGEAQKKLNDIQVFSF
jgi:hypothetical protein